MVGSNAAKGHFGPVRLSFQSLIFIQPAVFFSHNKSANSTFSCLFSAQANRLFIYSRMLGTVCWILDDTIRHVWGLAHVITYC
jgi:hypothetical protein